MYQFKIDIPEGTQLDLMTSIKDYIHEFFYTKVIEPEWYAGYLVQWLNIYMEENPTNKNISAIIEYKVWKDKEYLKIQERLETGL